MKRRWKVLCYPETPFRLYRKRQVVHIKRIVGLSNTQPIPLPAQAFRRALSPYRRVSVSSGSRMSGRNLLIG